MNYFEIGQRIRKYRKAHRMSQDELAERVGISTTHMSHIETGNTKLSLQVLVALAESLDVRTDDLLFDENRENRNEALDDLISAIEDCSSAELKVLTDIIKTAKISMSKYLTK